MLQCVPYPPDHWLALHHLPGADPKHAHKAGRHASTSTRTCLVRHLQPQVCEQRPSFRLPPPLPMVVHLHVRGDKSYMHDQSQ
jgi:hypothetical protein